jgi:plasmid stability protein
MGDLLIRNVAEALKADLDMLANRKGQSLSDAAKEALRDGIELAKDRLAAKSDELPLGQRLKAIFEGVFETQEGAEEFHQYLEEQRKAGVSRPLPDVE